MKRMSFQLSVKALLVAFFMIGGFVAVTETSAQSGSLSGNSVATAANLVDVDEATIRLTNEVETLHSLIGTWVPGSPSHTYAMVRIVYYKAIVGSLHTGSSVQSALSQSLVSVAGDAPTVSASKQELNQLYAQTVQLLTL